VIQYSTAHCNTSEALKMLCVCGMTSSNRSSTQEVGQKSSTPDEECGMPCPVPIQPHSTKVRHWIIHWYKIASFVDSDCHCLLFINVVS